MSAIAKQVYVISDLHLGGAPATHEDPSGRGFRMCTRGETLAKFIKTLAERPRTPALELVINGDFVDFLAEEGQGDAGWTPFNTEPKMAEEKFRSIAKREAAVFRQLKALLHNGHHLTIILGNHDLELSLPVVRAAFSQILELSGDEHLRYIFDGEAYVIGDVLIEHGNRYDGFNIVDHNALREIRSLHSRHQSWPKNQEYPAPVGSHLVVEVMNLIKKDFSFVDLLKPETAAVLPFLLALDPGYRNHIAKVAKYKATAIWNQPKGALPSQNRFRTAGERTDSTPEVNEVPTVAPSGIDDTELRSILASLEQPASTAPGANSLALPLTIAQMRELGMTKEEIQRASGQMGERGPKTTRVMGFLGLLTAPENEPIEERLPDLLAAIRILAKDRTFEDADETDKSYVKAAAELIASGFRYVIFGHTHLAKRVRLTPEGHPKGGLYLNSGTWADLIRLPKELFQKDEAEALAFLHHFIKTLRHPKDCIFFRPTYVRIDLDTSQRVTKADMYDYKPDGPADAV